MLRFLTGFSWFHHLLPLVRSLFPSPEWLRGTSPDLPLTREWLYRTLLTYQLWVNYPFKKRRSVRSWIQIIQTHPFSSKGISRCNQYIMARFTIGSALQFKEGQWIPSSILLVTPQICWCILIYEVPLQSLHSGKPIVRGRCRTIKRNNSI